MELRATYRYITTDLLTNVVLAEIPFRSVEWGRANRRAGAFSGSIPVINATKHLDLYNSTIPGRTALYVMRNDVCVWGGIVWSREYNARDRTLQVSGSEFISYFYHRFVWKSLIDRSTGLGLYAMSQPVAIGSYALADGVATIKTRPIDLEDGSKDRPHLLAVGDDVVLSNIDSRLAGGATVKSVEDDVTFTVDIDSDETIVETKTSMGQLQKSIDNYKFVRDIIKRTAQDFAGIKIERDYYLPGRTSTLSIISKSREGGVARITTSDPHELIAGEEVVVQDLGNDFDGIYTVSSVTSPYSFEYENDGTDVAESSEDGLRILDIQQFSAVGNEVTIKTSAAHGGSVGDEIIIDAGRPKGRTTITNPDMDIFNETCKIKSVVSTTKFTYDRPASSNGYWYFQRNIVKRGINYNPNDEDWTVTIEVYTPHNYLEAGKVRIIGLASPYDSPKDGGYDIVDIPTTKQFTYKIDRSRTITRRTSRGGMVTMYTDKAHGYQPGDEVVVSGMGDADNGGYNGTWVIDNTPNNFRFTFKKETVAKVKVTYDDKSNTVSINGGEDISVIKTGMYIEGEGIPLSTKVISIDTGASTITISNKTERSGKNVTTNCNAGDKSDTLTVGDSTRIFAGMVVTGTNNLADDTEVISVDQKNKKIRLSSFTTASITNENLTFKPRIILTKKYPDEAGADGSPGSGAKVKNITDVPFEEIKRSNDEVISLTNMIEINGGGSVILGPRAYIGTYGGFADNSDIGIQFLEETNAGVYSRKTNFTGSDLQSVGDVLEEISAGPDGFEYRIDCDFDKVTGSFTRTMVLSGYDYPEDPGNPTVRSLASLGADKFVFEYPGSIADFSISESAEESATRMWVTGQSDTGGDGSGAKQPMSAATSTDLLADGWPILDATEQIDSMDGSAALYAQAESFLAESLPPIDQLTVSVNGSIDPQVGMYKPGDWCSLLIEDDFMKQRLASSQEVRDSVIVRKIHSYTVSVPDSYGIPELVRLSLLRDTEVDTYGN